MTIDPLKLSQTEASATSTPAVILDAAPSKNSGVLGLPTLKQDITTDAGRDIKLPPDFMLKATVLSYAAAGPQAAALLLLNDTNNEFTGCVSVPFSIGMDDTIADLHNTIFPAALADWCTTSEIPYPDVINWLTLDTSQVPAGLASTPFGSIANAPTDLNPLTVLLGDLTGQLNDTNTKLNAALQALRDAGIIAS